MTLYVTDDSPRELTDGEWVVVKGVARWVPGPPKPDPEPEPIPTLSIARSALDMIACPYCGAKVTEACRNSGGGRRQAHKDRLTPRLCKCGALPAPWKTYCEPCRVKAREKSIRVREKRRREKKRKAKLAAVLAERFPLEEAS